MTSAIILLDSAGATPTPRSISVHTTLGNDVNNEQYTEISGHERMSFAHFESYKAQIRSTPSAVYNCHGLTFGARRTTIWDSNEIRKILIDDCYEQVLTEQALAGDVILYVSATGDVAHSGIVVDGPDQFGNLQVVSKWGRWSEVVHGSRYCPYQDDHVIEIHRINANKQCSQLQKK